MKYTYIYTLPYLTLPCATWTSAMHEHQVDIYTRSWEIEQKTSLLTSQKSGSSSSSADSGNQLLPFVSRTVVYCSSALNLRRGRVSSYPTEHIWRQQWYLTNPNGLINVYSGEVSPPTAILQLIH